MNGQKKKSWEEILGNLDRALRDAKPWAERRRSKPGAGAASIARRLRSALRAMSGRSKAAAVAAIFGAACALKLTGCGRPAPGSVTVAAETFRSTAPGDAGDDPRIAGSGSTGDAISTSLAVIHERLRDLQSAYRDKGRIEGGLKEVAERLRPLIATARADCDAIHRAAMDLQAQLPIAQAGYASAAASYRQRAEGYRDTDLKAITLGVARQFDWLSADTPRRVALTERFVTELGETQAYLAETERCLRDTEAALAVFSGGARMPAVATDGRALSYRLGQFISVVLDYEAKLLQTPPTGPPSPPPPALPAPKPEPSPPGAPASTTKRASAVDVPESEPQAAEGRTKFASSRRVASPPPAETSAVAWSPLPVGSRLDGEITTPSHSFRNHVRLEVLERSGDAFAGVVHYTGGLAVGRRGVRGRVSPDGRRLTFSAEWYEGNLSPEAIRYELSGDGGGFGGTWSTPSLRGTIRLGVGPA